MTVAYAALVADADAGRLRTAVVAPALGWVAAVDAGGRVIASQLPTATVGSTDAANAQQPHGSLPSAFALSGRLRADGITLAAPDATAMAAGSADRFALLRLLIWPLVVLTGIAAAVLMTIRGHRLQASRQARGGQAQATSPLRSDVRVERSDVRFDHVAGCDEAVDELAEIVTFLREPERFERVGATMPRGVILHGPPGTGKTLLAKAVAGEAGVPFFAASGSDFVEVFVGQGAARVRELFDLAAKSEEGAVIFVDEIDALGRRRASGPGGNDEREQTLNQLLVSMDGFGTASRVVVVAATNRLDLLDEALTRPGRFDRHVRVDLPSERGRLAILRVHAAGKPLADETSLERLARLSMGCSGAMLKTILNEAAIMAARDGRDRIEEPDLVEGQLRALAGPERRDAAHAEDELEIVAFHEAGHGLAAELCPTHDRAERITIKPRGQAGGLALYGQTDRMLMRPQALHEKLVVLLAGRAAEEIAFGSISSGAANDLQRATALARQAVEQLGFAASVGQIVMDPHAPLADETRLHIDREVRSLVDVAYDDALRLLRAHRHELDRLAHGLLDDRELDRAAIAALVGDVAGAPREAPRDAARPARRLRSVPAAPEPQVVVALENRRSAAKRAARLRDRFALAIETVLGADSERARKAS